MAARSFVVYEKGTGKLLHTHVVIVAGDEFPELQAMLDEAVEHARRAQGEGRECECVEVPPLSPAGPLVHDVQGRAASDEAGVEKPHLGTP